MRVCVPALGSTTAVAMIVSSNGATPRIVRLAQRKDRTLHDAEIADLVFGQPHVIPGVVFEEIDAGTEHVVPGRPHAKARRHTENRQEPQPV